MKLILNHLPSSLVVLICAWLQSSAVQAQQAVGSLASKASTEQKQFIIKARASEIDPKAKPHPEIDFVFEKDGKPQDVEVASVDTRVAPQGKLVVWLMGHDQRLFDRLNSYGLHAMQVSYANKWFGILCQPKPKTPTARGNVRLEAAIGEDVSDEIDIPKPDSMVERTRQFLIWLSRENPEGDWQQFLTKDQEVRWDKVIISGSSHGSTTAARFAKHQSVDRVVMLCGPRDQDQDWQSGPSATAPERFFGFSHVLDGGWTGDHYCRSWELLGLHKFGPIVNIDEARPPYENSRRLITAADVQNDAKKAHGAVQPNNSSPKDANGQFLYEPVWRYLYTHPVNQTGMATGTDPSCEVKE